MSTHLHRVGDEEPVRLDDLYAYFQAGAKPRSDWKVGVEFEKKVVRYATGQPVSFDEPDGIETILRQLAQRFHWEPHSEQNRLTALTRQGKTISLEPGGQLEFATSPVIHLGEVQRELDTHLHELHQVVDPQQITFISCGVSPRANIDTISLNPRPRHRLMAEVLPTLSKYGLHMMKCTCSTQVCLDYADTADAMRKFRLSLLLSPILNAAFNNAPWYSNRPTGYHSYRAQIWQHMDPSRSGWLIPLLQQGFHLEHWVNYALDVPLLFYLDDQVLRKAPALSFRQFMRSGIDGKYPTLSDWATHLSTIFTEVRLKQFLEIRGADALPRPYVLAVPAFWKGILYDQESLHAAEEMVGDWPVADIVELADVISHQSLETPWQGQPLRAWWRSCYELAHAGLTRQAQAGGYQNEARYLEPLNSEAFRTFRKTVESWSTSYEVDWPSMRELWAS